MKKMKHRRLIRILAVATFVVFAAGAACLADEEQTRQLLKQGLLGAGSGALAAGASGGKAGEGALIGAGTTVLGSALLDAITGPPASSSGRGRAAPAQEEYQYDPDLDEYYYEEPAQQRQSGTQQILKQGLVGAGSGALAAGASGGNAGKGALIGAGTTVLGSALLDAITEPPATRKGRVYKKIPQKQPVQQP
jgi:hypothetical protein